MYTPHGHYVDPPIQGQQPPSEVMRCGGVKVCEQCRAWELDAYRMFLAPGQQPPGLSVLNVAPPPIVPLTAAPQAGVLEVPVDELRDWYQRYLELKDAEAKIKDMVAEARATFLDALARRHEDLPDKVNMTIAGRPVLQRQVVMQSRVDTTRLRNDHPALAKEYSKQVRQERLNIL